MANAIIYSSLDPAGPGLRPALLATSNALPAVTRLYEILYPCLVTGYGAGAEAKPGQGWTLAHADLPNGFTLKAPDGVFYAFYKGANIPAPSSTAGVHGCQVYMAEHLYAPFTYQPSGTNVRSGDYAASNPGASARHWISFSNAYQPEAWWFLIARGSQVLFLRGNHAWDSAGGDIPSGSTHTSAMFFFGNMRPSSPTAPRSGPQASMFQGGMLDLSTAASNQTLYNNALGDYSPTPQGSDNPSATSAGCTRLRDFLSGVVESGALVRTTCNPTKHAQNSMARNNMPTLPADIRLDPVDVWLAGIGSVGKVPGLFHGGRSCHYRTGQLQAALGNGTSLTDCLTPVTIEGEPFYILPTGYGSTIVSLLEKYWA